MEAKASKKNSKFRPDKNTRTKHINTAQEQTPLTQAASNEQQSNENVSINIGPISETTSTTLLLHPQASNNNDNQQVVDSPVLEELTQDSLSQSMQISTGNEDQRRDIFIDIEPSSSVTTIVVEPQQINESNNSIQANAVQDLRPETSIASETDDISMLDTLTILNTANGSEVYLLGTAHFSPNSVKDVQKVMRMIRPNIVVLELCNERAFMLSLDEADLLEQNRNLTFDKVRSAIAQKGFAQGLIYIMFIKMSASLTEKLGLAPGSEFRAGANEAYKIPGCGVILGDRSLKVTLARAVASVSTWQKMKLIYQVLMNDTGMTQEEVEKCKDKDILEQLMQELGVEFPGFKRVILDERNIYLAHSIYHQAQNSGNRYGPQKVVAIVGIGHVSGIVEHWGKTKKEDIDVLNEIPEVSKTRRFVSKTIKYCSIALLVYVGYRVIVPSSIQNSVVGRFSRFN